MTGVGIDDIAIYFPKLYFDMKDFAEFRGADFGKLNKGLGLLLWLFQTLTKIQIPWAAMLALD